ncbi:MAG TPA: CopD family protein [Methylocella sp.]|nr:CopD family protein [Methylocella sp.]
MLMVYLPLVIARWIHFASVFVLFGSSFFWFYEGAERSSAGPGGLPRAVRATTILLRIAAPIAAISGIAWLACILINVARDFGSVVDPEDLRLFFFETPFGTVSFLRLALLAIGVVLAFLPWHGRWRFAALVPVGALLLITQAWFGHSAEGAGLYRASMITVYAIHTIAAAAWAGGLPALLFALVEQRRFSPYEARDCTLDVCSRFSLMAMIAVTLVVASGIANAGFRVAGSFGKLFGSAYGDVLLKKLAVVAALLAVAYFNRFIATPRLRAASSKGTRQITWLRYSVAFDVVLGALVLGASAILGITMPPQ